MNVRAHVPLAPLCTLELGGPARHFVDAPDEPTLRDALAWARARALPVFVLGGGSNVVVADAGYPGLVVRVGLRGMTVARGDNGATVHVTVAAGEPWDAVVERAVREGWAGLECLSGIPGSAGATPIQNVGAYGQEVAETITRVRVLDRADGAVRELAAAACGFAYRDSAFKRREGAAADAVVLDVTFALRPGGAPAVRYAELARALAARGSSAPSLAEVRETVLALRASKSMVLDPRDENRRSVGSFFTNPIVTAEVADEVARRAVARGVVTEAAEVPRFDGGAPGRAKLAAGWLIERSGFRKGERRGAVGLSSRHALALVHHGGGSARELLALAREIQARVHAEWGVALELEPVLVG